MLRRGCSSLRAELQSHGNSGCELQVFRDDAFLFGRWYPLHAIALAEADAYRRRCDTRGWTAAA